MVVCMANGDNYSEDRGSRPPTEEEPEERTDGWMTTYGDLVTLLLTFFVLLFAISNVDQQKATILFAGMSEGGLSVERYEEIMEWFAENEDLEGELPVIPEEDEDDGADGTPHQLEDLFYAIQDYIDANDLGNNITVEFDGDFLLLTLASDIVFPTNSATITEEMRAIAGELAVLISEKHTDEDPFEIIVTGHTDNVPAGGIPWRSNWQLSANRAINFLEILIEESNISPEYFYSSGFGEFHPVDTNNTPEGRQRNRRVEVMLSPLRLTEYTRIRMENRYTESEDEGEELDADASELDELDELEADAED